MVGVPALRGPLIYQSKISFEFQGALVYSPRCSEILKVSGIFNGQFYQQMKPKISINGELKNSDEALISANQRGFLFGDGLFETCRIWQGKILNQNLHWQRLACGLALLDFPEVEKVLERTKKDVQALILANSSEDELLRISVSRGIGSFGYLPTYDSEALIVVQTTQKRELPKKIVLGVSEIKAPKLINCFQGSEFSHFPSSPENSSQNLHRSFSNLKSSNSIPYILNKIRAEKQNFFDLIMLNEEGFVCETSSANVFWIKNNKIFTTSDDLDFLRGCCWQGLLKFFGDEIFEVRVKISDLFLADELFLTNSANLIILVDELACFVGGELKRKSFSNLRSKEISAEFLNYLHKEALRL